MYYRKLSQIYKLIFIFILHFLLKMNSEIFTKLAFEKVLDDSIKKMLEDLAKNYGEKCNFSYEELYELFSVENVKKRNESRMTYKN